MALVLAACSLPQGSPPTPRAQLDAATAQVRATGSLHLAGVYRADALNSDAVDLELVRGSVVGTVRRNQGSPVEVIGRDQRVFLRGADYLAATRTVLIADRWVENEGYVDAVVATIDTPGNLADLIDRQTRTFKVKARSVTAGGREATMLVANGTSVWVSRSPVRVIRIASQPAQSVFPVPLFDLALDRYGAKVHVPALPAQALDLGLPQNALPAFYEPLDTTASLDNCDQAGCTVSATVTNIGGTLGRTIATIEVSLDGRTTLASCQVPVEPTPAGQRQTIRCRVNFQGDQNTVYTRVEFKNV
jgi:hypothetical protein